MSCLTRQGIFNWIHWGYVFPQENKDMTKGSLDVCGIITTIQSSFATVIYKKYMANVEMNNKRDHDGDDMFKDYLFIYSFIYLFIYLAIFHFFKVFLFLQRICVFFF